MLKTIAIKMYMTVEALASAKERGYNFDGKTLAGMDMDPWELIEFDGETYIFTKSVIIDYFGDENEEKDEKSDNS